jgi:hypothetical protein
MSFQPSLSHEEYLKKKRRKKRLKYGIVILLILFLVGLVSYVSHRAEIRITKVILSGGVLVTQEEIESKILLFIDGSRLWLFPKNNAFLYPKKALENYLKETFRRIDTADIHLKDFQTLEIDVSERKPLALWCGSEPTEDAEHCYFMDQNGTVYTEAPFFSGDAYFKYYGRMEGETPLGKDYLASTTKFAEISDFISEAKRLSIHPQQLVAKENDEFSLVLSGGGKIYFDAKESLLIVRQNLEALLRTPTFASSTEYNLPVEYIDLRFGNKLFYKLK